MRQLFYLLIVLNLLLFFWIYQTGQQAGRPAIGDLQIIKKEIIQEIKSDVTGVEEEISVESARRESDDKQRQMTKEREKISTAALHPKSAKREVATTSAIEQRNPIKGWIIQAGSFSQKTNAYKLKHSINKRGLSAYIELIRHQDKTLYRVRIGPFLHESEAKQHLEMINKEFDLKGIVMNLE